MKQIKQNKVTMTTAQRWAFCIENAEFIQRYAALLRGSIPLNEFSQELNIRCHEKAHHYDRLVGSEKSFIYWQAMALRAYLLRRRKIQKKITYSDSVFMEDTELLCTRPVADEIYFVKKFMKKFTEIEQLMITNLSHGFGPTETSKILNGLGYTCNPMKVCRFRDYLKMEYRGEENTQWWDSAGRTA